MEYDLGKSGVLNDEFHAGNLPGGFSHRGGFRHETEIYFSVSIGNYTISPFSIEPEWLEGQISLLPYSLTGAQRKAIEDVRHDLTSGQPMNRLLQGDVGSGKTIVAARAIAMVTHEGAQAALMAPTSILAEQHYKNLQQLLAAQPQTAGIDDPPGASSPILDESQIRLMIGATPEAEKRLIRSGLADGSIRLVIGTHDPD